MHRSSTTRTWTLPTGDGVKTVEAQFRDSVKIKGTVLEQEAPGRRRSGLPGCRLPVLESRSIT